MSANLLPDAITANSVVRIQRQYTADLPWQELLPKMVGSYAALLVAAWFVMLGLGVLAHAGLPVPALGYWPTFLVLAGIQSVTFVIANGTR